MEQKLLSTIRTFIEQHHLITPDSTLIVGLSGGPDSVFLLHMLTLVQEQYNLKLIAAHLDHEWRTNSADDARFCQQLAQAYAIPYVMAKASTLSCSFKKNGSQEELGRHLRRSFFQHVKKEYNATSIALAHHAQDQQETFFIRLLRGSTLTGLTAMKPQDGAYIRPLLTINKHDILTYLDNNKIAYVTDPTNTDPTYLRNRIRQQVIPALLDTDDRFDTNFSKTVQHLQTTEQFLQQLTEKTFQSIAVQHELSWHLNLTQFFELDPFMQDRILLHWLIEEQVPFSPSTALLQEIKRFLRTSDSHQHKLYTWCIEKRNATACMSKR